MKSILFKGMDRFKEGKTYLKPGEKPPEGVQVKIGGRGGKYFEEPGTKQSSEEPSEPEPTFTASNGKKTLTNLSQADAREYASHGWKITGFEKPNGVEPSEKNVDSKSEPKINIKFEGEKPTLSAMKQMQRTMGEIKKFGDKATKNRHFVFEGDILRAAQPTLPEAQKYMKPGLTMFSVGDSSEPSEKDIDYEKDIGAVSPKQIKEPVSDIKEGIVFEGALGNKWKVTEIEGDTATAELVSGNDIGKKSKFPLDWIKKQTKKEPVSEDNFSQQQILKNANLEIGNHIMAPNGVIGTVSGTTMDGLISMEVKGKRYDDLSKDNLLSAIDVEQMNRNIRSFSYGQQILDDVQDKLTQEQKYNFYKLYDTPGMSPKSALMKILGKD